MNLEQQVKHLDKHYRDGNALVSDKQFDQLEKQLLAINPDSDYFTNRDALPLPSLEKDTIDDFIEGLHKDTDIVVEPKIDGCAVAIEYRDGILHKAITRKGKDITRKMTNVHSVPLSVPTKDTIQIRGELYTKDVAGNVSQRIAAGYLRSKSFIPNVNLKFCAFQIINAEINQWDALSLLLKLGFHAIRGYSKVPAWSLKEEHKYLYKNNFPTDGIVLKINDYKLQQTRPDYWQMAIKHY
nr:DNA ligase, NAD-dependent (TIGR00575) [uncultured Mediterranean phage uvMED]